MMSKNSIVPFLKDYLIKFLTRPFLLDTNVRLYQNEKALALVILFKAKNLKSSNLCIGILHFVQDDIA